MKNQKILIRHTTFLLATACFQLSLNAATVGWWRLEEVGASDGGAITTAEEFGGSTSLNGTANGTPLYSADVANSGIQEGLTGPIHLNSFSMTANAQNDEITIPNDAALNSTDWTVEFFIKIIEEPAAFDIWLQRRVSNAERWSIGTHHATSKNNYGKTTFNSNNTLAAGPGTATDKIFVDTDLDSGNTNDYDDPTDSFLDGDGINDTPTQVWHHLALTYTNATSTLALHVNYAEVKTISGALAHPNAAIEWGRAAAGGTETVLFDELRYSDVALSADDMLRAVPMIPEPSTYALLTGFLCLLFPLIRKHRS